jgi:hypothetical protein
MPNTSGRKWPHLASARLRKIAGMVAWLAGPVGHLVTGAALNVDGGANA